MDIKLNLYNNQTTEGWIYDANKSESEVICMVSRGIHQPHDVNLHWDSNRGLDSLIQEMERLIEGMKAHQKGKGNGSDGHLKILSQS